MLLLYSVWIWIQCECILSNQGFYGCGWILGILIPALTRNTQAIFVRSLTEILHFLILLIRMLWPLCRQLAAAWKPLCHYFYCFSWSTLTMDWNYTGVLISWLGCREAFSCVWFIIVCVCLHEIDVRSQHCGSAYYFTLSLIESVE